MTQRRLAPLAAIALAYVVDAIVASSQHAPTANERLVYLAVSALSFALATKAAARLERRRWAGGSLWLVFGAVMGLAFNHLWLFAQRLPPPTRNTRYVLKYEIMRFASLGTGVIFLMALLGAALPFALDLLERRSFASFVGARHIRATKSGFLTIISLLSMAGVGLSSCALCSVTSIMGGFGAELKRKILRNHGNIVVDMTVPGGFGTWEDKVDRVRTAVEPKGCKVTPIVSGDAMGSSGSRTAGVLVRGVDPKTIGEVIDLELNIEAGKLAYLTDTERLARLPQGELIGYGPGGFPYFAGPPPAPDVTGIDPQVLSALKGPEVKIHPGIIIGKELAKSLQVYVGEELTLLSPLGELSPSGILPRSRKFRVAAIFYSGMYEYDASMAFTTMEVAQRFFDQEGKITEIDVRVPDPEKVRDVRPLVDEALRGVNPDGKPGSFVRVRDWIDMNRNLFSALKLEKLMTFVILSIMIMVASFCIICTLLLMVTEKGKEIAILKAVGATDASILRIFMIEGVVIGAIGTTFGVSFALAVCTGLKWFGVRLDPDVYYVDRLPVNVNLSDYALVALASMIICTLSTLYPAKSASRLRPVEGLRWE